MGGFYRLSDDDDGLCHDSVSFALYALHDDYWAGVSGDSDRLYRKCMCNQYSMDDGAVSTCLCKTERACRDAAGEAAYREKQGKDTCRLDHSG